MPPASRSAKQPSAGSGATRNPCVEPPWEALLLALAQQTDAIDRLARSNEALVEALMQGEPEDDGSGSRTL